MIKSMDEKFEKEDLKTEFNNSMANSAFSDQFPVNFDTTQSFDSYFMDIFGFQDFTDLSDLLQPPQPPPPPQPLQPPLLMTDQFKGQVLSPATTIPESSEVVNTPATPNSSSISSSFNEAFRNEDLIKIVVDCEKVEDPKKTNKQQKKPKKEKKKKEGFPRFAFKTKCEMDNLDDGYRWRKYGQKAVKNSPFPRNYYRCTTPGCDVKKKVERSFEDHAILITTYEGRHIHPCPATTPRGLSLGGDGGGGGGGVTTTTGTPYSFLIGNVADAGVSGLGSGGGGGYIQSVQYHQPQHYQHQSFLGGETLNFNTITNSSLSDLDDLPTRLVQDKERRFCPSNNPIFVDGGLLEDIVTPQMFKKPKVEQKKKDLVVIKKL